MAVGRVYANSASDPLLDPGKWSFNACLFFMVNISMTKKNFYGFLL